MSENCTALRPVDDEKKTYPAGAPGTNPYFFGPIVNYSDSAPGSDKKTEIRLDGVITYHLHALNLSDTEKYLEHRKRRRGRWGKITRFNCYPTQKCTDSPHTARENKTKLR